jgi:mRNA-degrading endonuclease RelE of RelBE toxin-antitoxin system
MDYELLFDQEFSRDVDKLDKSIKEQLRKLILKIKQNPYVGKRLKGHSNFFRVRFGIFRVIYFVEGAKIYFRKVKKRDEVYQNI